MKEKRRNDDIISMYFESIKDLKVFMKEFLQEKECVGEDLT